MDSRPNVLITSVGRRNYLVRWFQDAVQDRGGLVVVSDADEHASAVSEGDQYVRLPHADDPTYAAQLLKVCREQSIALAISLNDFELSRWSQLHMCDFAAVGTVVLTLGKASQSLVEDKYAMATTFSSAGIDVPETHLASEVLRGDAFHGLPPKVVVKNRFGSGSAGLYLCARSDLRSVLSYALRATSDRFGRRIHDPEVAAQHVVVQPTVRGVEYGVDVVNNFSSKLAGVCARRKLRMRAGETDRAESVDPGPFVSTAQAISGLLQHRGLVDVDVVVDDADGRCWVLDVNPRFGGGYPFSHLAGADAPAAYIAWLEEPDLEGPWLSYRNGVVAAKREEVAVVP
jgi:carbamoyl-phosphate synthase large subunit